MLYDNITSSSGNNDHYIPTFNNEQIDQLDHIGYLLKYFHGICWGIPLISTLISLIAHAFGPVGSWCFIHDPTSVFRLLYYLPLVVVFFVNLCVFACIRWKISQHSNSIVSRVNIIVSFYLIAFALSQFPTVINSIQNFSEPSHPKFSLFAFQLLLQPLQGFFNCIVYGVNEGFISHYIEFFEKHLFRCRKSRELKQIEVEQERLIVDYDNSDEESQTTNMDQLIIDDYSIQ
ncbi:cAMP receptor-like protein [Heterostelium album PN500]|uniref:cAMP receptor-like protein n=1 Tax=Heterostelium pallidum (strain ATCC 26659 / Pp 5 / PN500) TaxID=670386 RepID=D3BHD8_HETP5|nr:cAMP receptor-like protein [Heterostelium album PN500]EFA79115.1 cAMP receptor-like protein [Heterostelium album PN500]|eukprot:XP_020431237.1 cAMP receptor-like protein [Heterostelium album PN500]